MQDQNEQNQVYQICPHLALGVDSTTKLLFPSEMGHCYHASPPVGVKLEHQHTHCLTAEHVNCPVFQQTRPATFPIKLHATPPQNPGNRLGRLVAGLAITAVLIVSVTFWLANRPVAAQIVEETAVSLPTVALIADTPTTQPEPTDVPTATTIPSATPLPTLSPTPLPTVTSIPSATATAAPTETAVSTEAAVVPSTETPNPEPQVIVNVDRLNIRSGPSTEYPILFVADAGTAYTVTGSVSAQDWWEVCCVNGDQIGWVFAGSIAFDGDANSVPPAAIIPPVPTATETAVP
ncbi:MAG: SH3 domain-containing protein [Chloroflexota bacterium]